MIKTFKYKLRPTKAQRETFAQWLGTCRFLYNIALEHRISHYQSTGKGVNYYDQANQLKSIKKLESFEWIGRVPSQTLQDVLERLEKTYQSFFKGGGFPKWAKKHRYKSFTLKSIKTDSPNRFKLPKIGSVKYFNSRPIVGKLKRATITKEGNSWFISVMCEVENPIQYIPKAKNQSIGIDWGVKHFYTTSDGHHEPNPRFFRKYEAKIAKLNQSLSKKTKGSHNWKNTKRQLRRLHSKIARARKDWHHKLSTNLVRDHQQIFVENLNIKGMTRKPKPKLAEDGKTYLPNMAAAKAGLNKSILDTAPSQFFGFLEYKSIWYQRDFVKVHAPNTSRACSECGHTSKDNRTTQELFLCVACGLAENADTNASINILGRGYTSLQTAKGESLIA